MVNSPFTRHWRANGELANGEKNVKVKENDPEGGSLIFMTSAHFHPSEAVLKIFWKKIRNRNFFESGRLWVHFSWFRSENMVLRGFLPVFSHLDAKKFLKIWTGFGRRTRALGLLKSTTRPLDYSILLAGGLVFHPLVV